MRGTGKRLLMLAVALGIWMSAARAADPVAGKVVGVHDGDTITVLAGEKTQIKVRLYGIDAPEGGQAFGNKAKQALSALVFGKTIKLDIVDRDRYGRSVANVHADGNWVNERMVSIGMAWHYKAYSKDPRLAKAEDAAREKRLGLWQDADPVPPWAYRRPPGKKGGATVK